MPINYVYGDATCPLDVENYTNKIIVHICNDLGYWNKGFVQAISNKWNKPEYYYRKLTNHTLGLVQYIKVEQHIWVCNMIAQKGINRKGTKFIRRVDYDILQKCLKKAKKKALSINATIHMPKIGSGLAGGDWAIIEGIITKILNDVPVMVYQL